MKTQHNRCGSEATANTPDTVTNPKAIASVDVTASVQRDLTEILVGLSFPAFAYLMQQLLGQSGYRSVHVVGRQKRWGRTPRGGTHRGRDHRGRTAQGGVDLTAYTTTDVTSVLTIAQVKQYKRPVSRRFVDELRGAMLRLGASQGLLVTTSSFSQVAERSAGASETAPITLIDGAHLTALMFSHRLGITHNEAGEWQVDNSFFRQLAQSTGTEQTPLAPAPSRPTPPVTVACAGVSHKALAHKALATPEALAITSNRVPNPDAESRGMTGTTHALIGVNSLWLLELLPHHAEFNFGILAAVAALGALLPDLDAAESKIKYLGLGGIKPFYLPAQVIHRQFGHRGLTHSLLGWALVAVMLLLVSVWSNPWWGWQPSLVIVCSYGSHLAADACTKSGIPFLYPRPKRYTCCRAAGASPPAPRRKRRSCRCWAWRRCSYCCATCRRSINRKKSNQEGAYAKQ